MKQILISLCLFGVAMSVMSAEGDKRELLAEHETVAEFLGLQFKQCLGRTSLCPDQCGQSGNFATFRIIKYVNYKKHGQYGDPQGTTFVTQVDDNLGKMKLPEAQVKLLRALQKGDFVRLDWHHDYVTTGGSSSPERPLIRVVKLSVAEARQLAGDTALEASPAKPEPSAPQRPSPR